LDLFHPVLSFSYFFFTKFACLNNDLYQKNIEKIQDILAHRLLIIYAHIMIQKIAQRASSVRYKWQ